MSLELPFGYRPVKAIPNIDERYGTYNSIQEALNATRGLRKQGLTVGIISNGDVDEFWFRSGIEDNDLVEKLIEGQSEIITVENATVYDPNKENDIYGFAYYSGNTYVSYGNESSSNPQFQNEALYRCVENALKGESPETHPEKWIYQGTSVTIIQGNVSNTIVVNLESLKSITKYQNTDSVFVVSERAWYKFDEFDNSGVFPNDNDNNGSWILIKKIDELVSESIYDASGSTALNNDDQFTYIDKLNNWILRKISWNNIKSLLKSYFDTIYSTFSGSYDDLNNKPDLESISLWKPEIVSAATTEHPRWDEDPDHYGVDKFGLGIIPTGFIEPLYNKRALGKGYCTYIHSITNHSGDNNYRLVFSRYNSTVSNTGNPSYMGLAIIVVRSATTEEQNLLDGAVIHSALSFEGEDYDAVKIGNQVWVNRPLSYLPQVNTHNDSSETQPKYYVYDYNGTVVEDAKETPSYTNYGVLYNTPASEYIHSILPGGFGVLSNTDWDDLVNYLTTTYLEITTDNIAMYLKSTRQVNSPFEFESDVYIKPKVDELTSQKKYVKSNNFIIPIQNKDSIFNLASGNEGTYIRYTGATDITVTVPNSILVGQPITLWQAGAGKITLVGDTGVILNGNLSTAGQHTAIQIIKVADNLFDVIGGVA